MAVSSALEMIYNGYLNDHTIAELSTTQHVSERHLRKLFKDNLGVSPNKIAIYHRAIFCKKNDLTHGRKFYTNRLLHRI